ncbi:citramalyl-CoA lyase, mitochondrial-like [Mytilus californianus]|uniref:citramalyl-CoA lyase, mitochondrial-like n=1 Tax=Mytilus californianus TaxID=6549 RepID=UPI00224702C4|nr:citramalyl-CoA lyase, mitochondrial-like [Mytilus californianus]
MKILLALHRHCYKDIILPTLTRSILNRNQNTRLSYTPGCLYSTVGNNNKKKYIPRRSVLYVPGNDERKINKVVSLDVDCVVLDCEDGVAANRKSEARSTIANCLGSLAGCKTDITVRVNPVSSGLMEEDLKVVFKSEHPPKTLMLPKVDTPEEIDRFTKRIKEILSEKQKAEKFSLITMVESAVGLMNLKDVILQASSLARSEKLYTLEGVVFGSDDFCADIGATRTNDAKELLYARQKIITCAKTYRLQAIDLVYIDYKDLAGFQQQAEEGARMGFTGKQVIHPDQIPVVNAAFSPSKERVQWATEMIQAFDEHQKSGQGAFVFDGKMIDMPLVLQARNIVSMAQAVSIT